MKKIDRLELRILEKELEQLETQAIETASANIPDEFILEWIEGRANHIKTLLLTAKKKAQFSELGLRVL